MTVLTKELGKKTLSGLLVKSQTDEEYTLTFLASDESDDRDGDTIKIDGWELDNFNRNGVILLDHNSRSIESNGLAKPVKAWVEGKELFIKVLFDSTDERAMKIYNKYKNGFLNSVSVGFVPKEYSIKEGGNDWWGPFTFYKQELIELSLVTIGANQNARLVGAKGLSDAIAKNGLSTESFVAISKLLEQSFEKISSLEEKIVTLLQNNLSGAKDSNESVDKSIDINNTDTNITKQNDLISNEEDSQIEPSTNETKSNEDTTPESTLTTETTPEPSSDDDFDLQAYITELESNGENAEVLEAFLVAYNELLNSEEGA